MRSPNGTARRSRATPAPAGTAGAGPAEPASARATSHISVPAASEPASSATTPPPAASTPTVIADESTEPVTRCSDSRPIRSRAVRSTSEGKVRAETTDASPPMPMAATMAASWPRSSARPTIAADDATASVSAARRTTAITRGVWAGARLASRMARVARPKSASAPNGKQKART